MACVSLPHEEKIIKANAINFIFFQLNWFACVLGANSPYPWLFPIFTLVYTWYYLSHLSHYKTEKKLIAFVLAVALAWELSVQWLDVMNYKGQMVNLASTPIWIYALWLGFALTLNHSMKWISSVRWAPPILGAIFGPLTYLAGAKFGSVSFTNLNFSIIYTSISWAILFTVVVMYSSRLRESE